MDAPLPPEKYVLLQVAQPAKEGNPEPRRKEVWFLITRSGMKPVFENAPYPDGNWDPEQSRCALTSRSLYVLSGKGASKTLVRSLNPAQPSAGWLKRNFLPAYVTDPWLDIACVIGNFIYLFSYADDSNPPGQHALGCIYKTWEDSYSTIRGPPECSDPDCNDPVSPLSRNPSHCFPVPFLIPHPPGGVIAVIRSGLEWHIRNANPNSWEHICHVSLPKPDRVRVREIALLDSTLYVCYWRWDMRCIRLYSYDLDTGSVKSSSGLVYLRELSESRDRKRFLIAVADHQLCYLWSKKKDDKQVVYLARISLIIGEFSYYSCRLEQYELDDGSLLVNCLPFVPFINQNEGAGPEKAVAKMKKELKRKSYVVTVTCCQEEILINVSERKEYGNSPSFFPLVSDLNFGKEKLNLKDSKAWRLGLGKEFINESSMMVDSEERMKKAVKMKRNVVTQACIQEENQKNVSEKKKYGNSPLFGPVFSDVNFGKVTTGDTPYTSVSMFEDLNLSEELLKGLYVEMKLQKPSKFQAISLPMILTPPYKDLITQAHNGSGQTTCFVLGMLSRVDPNVKAPQAICICPTRELVIQNLEVLQKMGKHTGITSEGTVPMDRTNYIPFAKLAPITAQVVIGTPVTIKEWMSAKKLGVSSVKILAFDENEVLAEGGFKDDSLEIIEGIERMSSHCQVLFSTTFNETVKNFALSIVKKDSNQLFVEREKPELVKQFKVYVPDELSKVLVVKERILELGENLGQTIIFVSTKEGASVLHMSLVQVGYAVTTIVGSLRQEEYDKLVEEFRDGLTQVLISTDTLPWCFDQQQVNLVINYDLPTKHDRPTEPDYGVYLHRVGRAGHFGCKGAVVNLLCGVNDETVMGKIESHFCVMVKEVPNWRSLENFKAALKSAGLL